MSSIPHQALCIISDPSVNSNWSYSPETPNLGSNLKIFLALWPCNLTYDLENNRAPLLCYFQAFYIISSLDDSNVFVTADNATTLQQKMKEVLLSIFIWFKANKLTANINKTAYSIFKRNGVIPGCLNSIKIDNEVINRVKEVKYLGIILDDKLNWEAHIDELNKSLTKTINAFKIIKN